MLATASRLGVPVTVHVAVGTDIHHMHAGADGAALGETSHRDFELLAGLVATLEGGVYFNVGSAVILPEDCAPLGPARPICSFTNPEDIVPLPGAQALLIGEYGSTAADQAGGLVLFELATERVRPVYRGGTGAAEATQASREVRGEGSRTQKSVLTMSLRREAERR